MVLALTLLIACWLVIGVVLVYVVRLAGFAANELETAEISGTDFLIAVGKVVLHVIGWAILLVAFFRSEWSIDAFDAAWANMLLTAVATAPAAAVSAVLTVLLTLFLPGAGGGRRVPRVANVVCCLLITGVSAFGTVFLLARFGTPAANNLAGIVLSFGFLPLLLVSCLFFAAAVGVGFGAGWVHPRAGGVRTLLFVLGLLATYRFLENEGPVRVLGEIITADIVEKELGGYALIPLFLAGLLGLLVPPGSAETSGTEE